MIKIWNFNLFLIILCICIFTSVTCVCASDINDTAYGNVDDLNINGNFSELEHEIAELSPGDTYNMDRDYCYNDGDSCVHGIEIFKDNITINGNGHTMDGQNKSLFFYITGNNVQILNLTFKNCHSKNTLINYPPSYNKKYNESKPNTLDG